MPASPTKGLTQQTDTHRLHSHVRPPRTFYWKVHLVHIQTVNLHFHTSMRIPTPIKNKVHI